MATVPDVSGATDFNAAKSQLQAAGFTGNINKDMKNSTKPNNAVIGTNPAAGQVIRKNADISVQVSNGSP
jgi:beta-lactam-binding protein with PASTA domain